MASKSKIRTSFQGIVLIRRRPVTKIQQSIRVKSNWLIRDNKRKCFLCSGIPNLVDGNVSRFYLKAESYPHQKGCENRR